MPRFLSSTRNLANIAAPHLSGAPFSFRIFDLIPVILATIGILVAMLTIYGAAGVLRGLESGRDTLSLSAASAALVTVVTSVYFGFARQLPTVSLLTYVRLFSTHVMNSTAPAVTASGVTPGHDLSTVVLFTMAVLQLLYCVSLYRHMAVS